jgi:hypothetical protein
VNRNGVNCASSFKLRERKYPIDKTIAIVTIVNAILAYRELKIGRPIYSEQTVAMEYEVLLLCKKDAIAVSV